jgi:hypothetical protein
MRIHFSVMSGKLEGLRAISTNTATNEFCIDQNKHGGDNNICTKCYSHAMLRTYRKNMAPALQRNSDYLSSALIPIEHIPFIPDAYLRIDAHGELINDTHFMNILRIAERNPHCSVALWTKRVDIVRRVLKQWLAKPANLILIYSNPKIGHIMPKPPRGFDRSFNNVPADMAPERQNCTGQKCITCMLCYTIGNGVDTIVEKVKKY